MILVFLYMLFDIPFAWVNYKLFEKGKRIYHGLNGLLHFGVAVVIGCSQGWQFGLATLFITRAVFDAALNKFRGLPLGYISSKPKSIIDRLEKNLILWIVSKTTSHVIVDNEVKRVSVWLKVFYLVCALFFCLVM